MTEEKSTVPQYFQEGLEAFHAGVGLADNPCGGTADDWARGWLHAQESSAGEKCEAEKQPKPALPRVIWEGHEYSDGSGRPIRVVHIARKNFRFEIDLGPNAMEQGCWSPLPTRHSEEGSRVHLIVAEACLRKLAAETELQSAPTWVKQGHERAKAVPDSVEANGPQIEARVAENRLRAIDRRDQT